MDFVPTPDDETRFMDPLPATPLPLRYEVLGELGRGGMGIVCKVRDRETGEILALKILKPEIAAHPEILERFKNELLLAHKITHRHVARLYEFHRAGDAVYLSMEYVEGESLRSLLEREGRLETGRALGFARQLASGLAEAHRQSNRAKSNAVGRFALGLEQPAQVINQSYWERYPAKVNAVSASEIQAVAQKYLAPDRAHIVAVGDAARIRSALEKLRKVEG
jgi:Protein kinase domain